MGSMIPFAKPWMGDEEVEAAARVIRSGWITSGPEVDSFEKEFAAYAGAPYACAVANCTAALHLALLAIGVGPGDEVITVSHSFLATANCIRYMDAIPVFADIQPLTYNMDPAGIERLITSRTKAILCVHQIGMPCDLAAILEVAARHGIKVVEDGAPAIGSEILWNGQWEKIGRPQGDVACFSFHARKVISTGDGGMLTTRNREYDDLFRRLRCHGMSLSDIARHDSSKVKFEEYVQVGYNYRLTDIQAAIGRVQLGRLPEIVRRRRRLAEVYKSLLGDIEAIGLPVQPAWARSNWQSFCIMLPEGADQLATMQYMQDHGVATRRGVHTSHMESAYLEEPWRCGTDRKACGCSPGRCRNLPNSENARLNGLLLPMFPELNEGQVEYVVKTLKQSLGVG
jgi:perosamine synthetase